MSVDLIVVGGGVIGLSAAFLAARGGLSVPGAEPVVQSVLIYVSTHYNCRESNLK